MENLIISTLATRKKTMLALFFINYAVLLIKYILTLLIIFNLQSLIFNPHAQTWQVYTTSNSGLPSNGIASIAFDTNNVKWIGTDNGLAKFDGINWTVYDTSNSQILRYNIVSLAIDMFNVLWLGTNGGG